MLEIHNTLKRDVALSVDGSTWNMQNLTFTVEFLKTVTATR